MHMGSHSCRYVAAPRLSGLHSKSLTPDPYFDSVALGAKVSDAEMTFAQCFCRVKYTRKSNESV